MKILICNVGSTSLKYRLFDDAAWECIARGKVERIGSDTARYQFIAGVGGGAAEEGSQSVKDYEAAISLMLSRLVGEGRPLARLEELSAVGFKVVHAKGITGVQLLDERVMHAMQEYASIAPRTTRPTRRPSGRSQGSYPGCRWWEASRPVSTPECRAGHTYTACPTSGMRNMASGDTASMAPPTSSSRREWPSSWARCLQD